MVVTLSTTAFVIMICFISLNGLSLFVLGFLSYTTPIWTFFSAWRKKSPIIAMLGRDQSVHFLLGQPRPLGIIKTKYGPYFAKKNSHVIEHKSRARVFFAFNDFAQTLNAEDLNKLDVLREKLLEQKVDLNKIITWDDFEAACHTYLKDEDQLKLVERVSFKVHDLPAFSQEFNPVNMERYHETEKMIETMSLKNKLLDSRVILFIVIILIAGGIAFYIASRSMQEPNIIVQAPRMAGVVKAAATNLTG